MKYTLLLIGSIQTKNPQDRDARRLGSGLHTEDVHCITGKFPIDSHSCHFHGHGIYYRRNRELKQ
jgi:hypothetical protein